MKCVFLVALFAVASGYFIEPKTQPELPSVVVVEDVTKDPTTTQISGLENNLKNISSDVSVNAIKVRGSKWIKCIGEAIVAILTCFTSGNNPLCYIGVLKTATTCLLNKDNMEIVPKYYEDVENENFQDFLDLATLIGPDVQEILTPIAEDKKLGIFKEALEKTEGLVYEYLSRHGTNAKEIAKKLSTEALSKIIEIAGAFQNNISKPILDFLPKQEQASVTLI